jgi:ABC-2 type transport system permease protein
MSQLFALVWLKWTLMRNSLRSRRAVVGRVAAALGMLAGLALSLVAALGVGVGAYFIAASAGRGATDAQQLQAAFAVLLFIFTVIFLMWSLMPIALGGGSRFEPARMLLYPVSLGKLFAFDFVSDLTSLSSVLVVPSLFALCAGVGLGRGNLPAGLAVACLAVAFGLSFSKLLSTGVGALMRARRTRGETALAIVGAALGMTGILMGQLMPYLERHSESLGATRWTPPGAAAYALARGLFAGDASALGTALLTLGAYTVACVLLAYRVARRTALGAGGGGGGKRAAEPSKAVRTPPRVEGRAAGYAGWQLPFVSQEFSALFEKELRYALRNAQLRVIAVMAVALTVVLRMGPAGARTGRMWGTFTPYAEGAGAVFSVIYIFMLVSPISTNVFGYDGAGMRALVLSPVSRRTVLLAKNAAVTLISLVLVTAGVGVGGFFLGGLTAPVLLFALLSFVTTAALFAPFGNWLSLQFPKRVRFGKRMNRSGVAGLLLVPLFALLLVPPGLAIAGAHFAGSHVARYVILAAFALLSAGLYALLLPVQGRSLERRELEILEAVTGRGGSEDEQIIG